MAEIIYRDKEPEEIKQAFQGVKIAIGGAGAIGSLIGGYLTRAGVEVWFVGQWLDHVSTLKTRGLLLQDPDSTSLIQVKALDISEVNILRDIDILLVCVKSYDTSRFVSVLKPCLSPGGFAVSCQNGINEESIASIIGASFTLGCVIHLGATLVAPGHVKRIRRGGRFIVGELNGKITDRVKSLALLLSSCAETIITDNLWGHRWVKLAYNSSENPLLALSGYTVEELHSHNEFRPIIRAIILELIQVAEAYGYHLEPIHALPVEIWKTDIFTRVEAIEDAFRGYARILGNRRSSMVYDLEQGRPMEIDFLNGYIVKKGEDAGISVPINRAIVEMVHDLERGRLRPDPMTLVSLLSLVKKSYHK